MFQHRFFRALSAVAAAAAVLVFASAGPVQTADPLPQPAGKVVLTVSGNIEVTNAPGEANFDLDMLRALGEHTLVTSEFTAPGVHEFKGVLYSAVMDRVGARGEKLTAKALDNYTADIPLQDFRDYPALIAYEKNGERLRVRTKGPIRTILPLDQHPELKNATYEARSIWQLRYLIVK